MTITRLLSVPQNNNKTNSKTRITVKSIQTETLNIKFQSTVFFLSPLKSYYHYCHLLREGILSLELVCGVFTVISRRQIKKPHPFHQTEKELGDPLV